MTWSFRKKMQPAGKSGVLRLLRAVVLAAPMLFSFVVAGVSSAEEMPTAQPAETMEETETSEPEATVEPAAPVKPAPPLESLPPLEFVPVDPFAPAVTPPLSAEPEPAEPFFGPRFEKTADETHERVQRNLLEQIIRLDNFYGTARTDSRRQTGYEIRLRNAFRFGTDGNFKYGPSIRAHITLAKVSEKLRLTIAGDNEPTPVTPSLPEDPGNPGFDRISGNNTRLVNTELRYRLIESPSMNMFLGTGIRVTTPPQAFARARFSYTYHLSDISLLRFQETLFIRNPDGLGETTEFDLERLLDKKTLLRWATTGTASTRIKGMEWGSELSWIHELSPKSAVTVMGGFYGDTKVDDGINNYRLLTRYRRNFLRSWLFYELEPELFWPRREDKQFPTHFAFSLRFEIVFEGRAEKK